MCRTCANQSCCVLGLAEGLPIGVGRTWQERLRLKKRQPGGLDALQSHGEQGQRRGLPPVWLWLCMALKGARGMGVGGRPLPAWIQAGMRRIGPEGRWPERVGRAAAGCAQCGVSERTLANACTNTGNYRRVACRHAACLHAAALGPVHGMVPEVPWYRKQKLSLALVAG